MESEFGKDRFQWELVFYLAALGLLAVLLIELCNAFDILEILYFIAVVPLVGLTVLILAIVSAVRKKQRQSLSRLIAVLAYCAISWKLWKDSMDLRPAERWLVHSMPTRLNLWRSRSHQMANCGIWNGTAGVGPAWTPSFIWSTTRMIHLSPKREAIPKITRRRSRAMFGEFVGWRTTGTPSCFTRIVHGMTASSPCRRDSIFSPDATVE